MSETNRAGHDSRTRDDVSSAKKAVGRTPDETVSVCPECDTTNIWPRTDDWRCGDCGACFAEPVWRAPKRDGDLQDGSVASQLAQLTDAEVEALFEEARRR